MSGFKDYVGTPFLPALLPIIPVGAKLSAVTNLTPDRIGKIPGELVQDGWKGFEGWQNHFTTEGLTKPFDRWFSVSGRACATIGTQAAEVPAVDSDVDHEFAAKIVARNALMHLGMAPRRGRPNSLKCLWMYRLKAGAAPITKKRLAFRDPMFPDRVMAVEVLGKGQHYIIEGEHPSGVMYEWNETPLQVGYDNLTEIDNARVGAFLNACRDELVAEGFEIVKGGAAAAAGGGGTTGERYPIADERSDLCPDLALLADLLKHCPCDADEFASRDAWLDMLVAIKAACGGDEAFYDEHVLPWCTVDSQPGNTPEYVRERWESVHDAALGWSYLCAVAQDFDWYGLVETMFEELPVTDDTPANPTPPPPPMQPDEAAIADRFVAAVARKKWTFEPHGERGIWRRFQDGIWVEDGHSIIHDVSKQCTRVGATIRANPQASATDLRIARSMYSDHAARAVRNLVKSDPRMHVQPREFDRRPWLIACPAGYIDENNVIHAPDPQMLFTRQLGVRPDFDAKCPIFDARMTLMCDGDIDMVEAMLRAFGYSLSGTGQEQKFFYLYGPGGEGKTTLLELMARVAGTYGTTISHRVFMRSRDEQRFGTAKLAGAWYAYSSEVDEGEEWADAVLKTVTGSGMLPIERKNIDATETRTRVGLWFQGNGLPRFRKLDQAIIRRMVLLSFRRSLPESEQRKGLVDEMMAAEGPAIAARVLRARQRYLHEGLLMTPQMIRDRDSYAEEFDKIGEFLRDTYQPAPGNATPVKEVHNQWLLWRQDWGEDERYAGSVRGFGRELRRHQLWREWNLSEDRVDYGSGRRDRQQKRSIIGITSNTAGVTSCDINQF